MAAAAVRAGMAVIMAVALAACSASDATSPQSENQPSASPAAHDTAGVPTRSCMLTATGATVCPNGTNSLPGNNWQLVSVGGDHTCALTVSGSAYCWGSNRDGQLGNTFALQTCGSGATSAPCSLSPIAARGDKHFVSISAGARHTCGITTGGSVECWGADDLGQASGAIAAEALRSQRDDKNLTWVQVSAGFSHSCAVRSDGAAYCWGANERGQLGDGSVGTSGVVRVALADPIASVSAGQSRSCARSTANAVYCWGAVWTDREGNWEMSRTQPMPEPVPSSPRLGTLSVGAFTTCGSDPTGAAYCWEANPRGEMGVGANAGSTAPIRVATGGALSHVSAGMLQSCGVAEGGVAYCWGDDSFGQLGVPATALSQRCDQQKLVCSTVPVQVSGSLRFVQLSAGLGSHTCGVTVDGAIACWGLGVSGQRGDGTTEYIVSTPTVVRAP